MEEKCQNRMDLSPRQLGYTDYEMASNTQPAQKTPLKLRAMILIG